MKNIPTNLSLKGVAKKNHVQFSSQLIEKSSIEKFVHSLKFVTHAVELNIFSQNLTVLYKDSPLPIFNDDDRIGMQDKLVDFRESLNSV